jgi:hypothetical protein
VSTQPPPQEVRPASHEKLHDPPLHEAVAFAGAEHRLPQVPQLSTSLDVSAQRPAQSVAEFAQLQLPWLHTAPDPRVDAHCVSTAGSSSMIPLQSSSRPLQLSGAYVHLQTSLIWPPSAPHVQPERQSPCRLHGEVQTL